MKKLFFVLPLVLLLTGCNILNPSKNNSASSNGDISSHSSQGEESSSSASSTSSSSSSQQTGNSYTIDFRTTSFTDGTNVDNKSTEFLEFLNKGANAVTSASYDNCYFHGTGKTGTPTSLEIGTGNYAGSITFNFAYSVSKITFTIQGHHKWNSYGSTWSLDADSQLTVEGQTFNVGSTDTSQEPAPEEHEITIASPHQSITFNNSGDHQRAFLHSLTVEFVE